MLKLLVFTCYMVSAAAQVQPAANTPAGNWSGGALLQVEASRSASPVLRAFDRRGREISKVTLTIPDASSINVYSGRFARGFDGSVAVAGSAYTKNSRGMSFIAWVSPDSARQTVIRVSPFVAHALTIAADGSIWAAGFDNDRAYRADSHVIRRFDRTGRLIGSATPRSTLKITDAARFTDPTQYSYLASSKDRVGWFSEAAGVYIAFSLNGDELSRVTVPPASSGHVHGLALCDDGRAFTGIDIYESPRKKTGWGVAEIDSIRGELRLMPWGHTGGPLYGCDGTELVAQTNGAGVSWLMPGK